ncbi:extracellular solute-binding protein [Paenibacillus radicis (ex Xue et al. 2023)]|uniref:Extracellular solute-binding protein n=1 Tax=Paenibacillus radicis (ex Xue et al. 2023) TaxID=2972489 RepID=A0ABT1YU60_9BACL|nr:extracellular solute-binding protein [Paenibacillus radicis (ex Xue et al. 2023)]MCR8635818.1 extracellular solute-binding protein [Paenibacillus radicis (ex Xue et al. 2023)]
MRKKMTMLALSAALAAGTLAGCSSGGDTKGQTNPQGKTDSKPVKLKVGIGTEGLQYIEGSANINEDKYTKKLREISKTDVTLELIPHREFDQKLTLLFAGGELPDLLQTHGINKPEVAPAIDTGVLIPLNELIDKYGPNLKKNIPKESWDFASVSKDGKIYGIPTVNATPNGNVMMVRKDWLDKLGLKPPKTVDEYIEMLKAFKDKDPNGNGKQDEIPFSGREKLAFTEAFFGAYDVIPADWKFENGQLIPNLIRPKMKDALAVYRTLYEQKLLDNEVFVQKPKDWDAKIKGQGIVGLWIHGPRLADKWAAEVRTGTPTAQLEIIPAPVGPDGKGGLGISSAVGGSVWVIPKTTKNPENAIKFLDWFYSDEAQKFLTYGIEGDDYTLEGGKMKYKYPEKQEDIYREEMHLTWLRMVGPSHLSDAEFMKNRPSGDLVMRAMDVAAKEGRKNDGLGMPALPTAQARPELSRDGLWLELAAKVITGKESPDAFDKFVEDWKKRGGDQIIKEATDWYKSTHK